MCEGFTVIVAVLWCSVQVADIVADVNRELSTCFAAAQLNELLFKLQRSAEQLLHTAGLPV